MDIDNHKLQVKDHKCSCKFECSCQSCFPCQDPCQDPCSPKRCRNEVKPHCNKAVGEYNKVAGSNSLAIGSENLMVSHNSISVGFRNAIQGRYRGQEFVSNNAGFGTLNSVVGDNSHAVGYQNAVQNSYSGTYGNSNSVNTDSSLLVGQGNESNQIDPIQVTSLGGNNLISGSFNSSQMLDGLVTGRQNRVKGYHPSVSGWNNEVPANRAGIYLMGHSGRALIDPSAGITNDINNYSSQLAGGVNPQESNVDGYGISAVERTILIGAAPEGQYITTHVFADASGYAETFIRDPIIPNNLIGHFVQINSSGRAIVATNDANAIGVGVRYPGFAATSNSLLWGKVAQTNSLGESITTLDLNAAYRLYGSTLTNAQQLFVYNQLAVAPTSPVQVSTQLGALYPNLFSSNQLVEISNIVPSVVGEINFPVVARDVVHVVLLGLVNVIQDGTAVVGGRVSVTAAGVATNNPVGPYIVISVNVGPPNTAKILIR